MSLLGLPYKSSLESPEYLSFVEEVRIASNQYGVVDENSIFELHFRVKVLKDELEKLEQSKKN
jgi:hypothetical protein